MHFLMLTAFSNFDFDQFYAGPELELGDFQYYTFEEDKKN